MRDRDRAETRPQLSLQLGPSPWKVSPDRLLEELLEREHLTPSSTSAESVCQLARQLGVEVRYEPIATLGQLLYDPRRPVILLRTPGSDPRQRFTLAHELAHLLVLRARRHHTMSLELEHIVFENENGALLEWHMERLASAILMPAGPFRATLHDLHVREVRGFKAAEALRDIFKASITAVHRRLATLCPEYVALSCTRRAVHRKPVCLRIDWSESQNDAVGFIPRHKSLGECGPVYEAVRSGHPADGFVMLETSRREQLVCHAHAIPFTSPGALVLVDLRPRADAPQRVERVPQLLTDHHKAQPRAVAIATNRLRNDGCFGGRRGVVREPTIASRTAHHGRPTVAESRTP